MRFGIRFRFAAWLLAVLLPVSIAGFAVFDRIEQDLSARIGADLEGIRELEASRIHAALESYRQQGDNLADGPHVRDFTFGVNRARLAGIQDEVIGGYDGFDEIDAFSETPLQELAASLLRKAQTSADQISSLQILGLDGSLLGETVGFDWEPTEPGIIERAVETESTLIGNAYRDGEGEDRLGVVVPIVGPNQVVRAVLLLETALGPIVDLVEAHEGFGETSEAHIAQSTADGDAEFITPLRFDSDAAFNRVVPRELGAPINQSLTAPEGLLIFAADYRSEDSILAVETIDGTKWGLVVKIDRAEALAPLDTNINALQLVGALAMLALLLGWAVFLDPVARRLRRMAMAAEQISTGEYDNPIDDRSTDEIGVVSRSIDRLATDLTSDIAVRADVENRLRHQATHDATTGLFNRQHATWLMQGLVAPAKVPDDANYQPFSLLFLDLDNFKAINDVHGHAVGDEVLKMIGNRLTEVIGGRGSVARWGGDEFVVVLEATGSGAAQDIAKQVQHGLDAQARTSVGIQQVRASIGVSTITDGDSLEQLLQRADEAMFAEKERRSGRRSVSPASVRQVERALETKTLEAWYQPRVLAAGSTVTLQGIEALVRLRNEAGEIVEPSTFISDVEASHVGRDMDRQVLWLALRQASIWISSGRLPFDFQVSVNASEGLMRDVNTVHYITSTLDEFNLAPRNLLLEISDRSSMFDSSVIDALKRTGVKIAVDGLGSSNSNLDRLLDTGASVAKIDHRWIKSKSDQGHDASNVVLQHLVSVCDSLGQTVIATGVETVEQYEALLGFGVTLFQGSLFAKPLTGSEFSLQFLQQVH